jgi:peroxiredoxin
MIQVGERLPAVKLQEYNEVASEGCAIGPVDVDLQQAATGKRIALFALPGAYTPTCSARHVPGYLAHAEALRAAGIDEIWCVSVNDAFVMHAWGRDQGVADKVRMLGDGNGAFARAVGLSQDMSGRGLGVRSQRYSMLLEDGVVKALNVDAPGKFEVSDAETLLRQATQS